jgi:hypothetical protein
LPFVVVAPIVTALGVAFLYGDESSAALEIQLATPVSPRVVLLGRLALIFGFNLVLSVIASVILTLTQADISLAPLILSWLAPMTFLSALSFVLSVTLFDPLASVLISMLLWVLLVARHAFESPIWGYARMPDFLSAEMYPLLFGLAVAAVVTGMWVAERENRFARGE